MSKITPTTVSPDAYSHDSFWAKARRYAVQAGRELIEKALWLHYAAQDERTPVWAKTTMYGALAYFILPADVIPDFVPAAGFTDDLGAVAAALAAVAAFITPEVQERAARRAASLFGEDESDETASGREAEEGGA